MDPKAWRGRALIGLLSLAALAVVRAPARADDVPGCTPGRQVACACPGAADGVQRCADDGRGYEACHCDVQVRPSGAVSERDQGSEQRPGKGLVAGGATMVAFGGLAANIGFGILFAVAAGVGDDDLIKDGAAALPAMLIVTGLGSVAGGIPMIVIGMKKNAAARVSSPGDVVPVGAGLQWSF